MQLAVCGPDQSRSGRVPWDLGGGRAKVRSLACAHAIFWLWFMLGMLPNPASSFSLLVARSSQRHEAQS